MRAESPLGVRPHDPTGRAWSRRARSRRRNRPALETLEARRLLTSPQGDSEFDTANVPVMVDGVFLTGGAAVRAGDAKAMAFDKVMQDRSDTCVFLSSLSAVAHSNVDLASGVTVASVKGPTDYVYNVRLYQPYAGGFTSVQVQEEINGTINSWDPKSSSPGEFWPALYQRAYVDLENARGVDYHDPVTALSALTGVTARSYSGASMVTVTAAWLRATLQNGSPVVAGTGYAANPYAVDPGEGVIGLHEYTVLGVDSTANGDYVTLRNPWGIDSLRSYSPNGLDGNDDGIIRVPFATFLTYYDQVTVSALTGPSLNTPQTAGPTFTRMTPATVNVYAGQTVGPLDLSATDPQNRPETYFVRTPGHGSVTAAGAYTWTPRVDEVGRYTVTVVARANALSSGSQTFTVNVLADVPSPGPIGANRTSVSAAGTDKLTLTAAGASIPFGTVKSVSFYLDTLHQADNSVLVPLDLKKATYLGDATAASGWALNTYVGASSNGYVGAATTGTFLIYAVANGDANGTAVSGGPDRLNPTSLTITAAPVYDPSLQYWDAQVQASPTAAASQTGLGVTRDSSDNTRVFYSKAGSPAVQYVREYSPRDVALTAPIPLAVQVSNTAESFVGAPDGSFYQIYSVSTAVKVQHYNAAAAAVGSPVTVATVPAGFYAAGAFKAALDANGDVLIVYQAMAITPQQLNEVYAVTLSAAGAVTRVPWLVDSSSTKQVAPTVALDSLGDGVIAWEDDAQGAVVARRVTGGGLSNGPLLSVYKDATAKAPSAGVDSQGNITLVYQGLTGLHGRRYGGNGTSDSGDFAVYTQAGDAMTGPRVGVNAQGWAFVAWDDQAYGNITLSKLISPTGLVQTTYVQIPDVTRADSLVDLVLSDNGMIAVEFNQNLTSGASYAATDFRLLKADMLPVFQQPSYGFTVPLGSAAGTAVGTVQAPDPDGDTIDYTILGPSPFTVDLHSGAISVFDANALKSTAVTSYLLTVRADDTSGAVTLPVASVVVTVVDPTPPTIAALPDRTVDANEFLTVALVGTDAAPAGAALTYSAVASGYGAAGSAPALKVVGNVLTVTPAAGYTGTFLVTTTATNGLASGSQTFHVNVVLPALAAVADQTVAGGPAVGPVTLSGTDASGAALTYTAAVVGAPATPPATFAFNNNVMLISPRPGYAGTFQVTASVSDGPNAASRTFNVTVLPPPPTSFARTDSATQGNWKPAYGGDGYLVAQDPSGASLPAYARGVSVAGQYNFVWTPSTLDPRALFKGSSAADRAIGAWYSPASFTIDVPISDGSSRQVALYALDPDSAAGGRTERFDLVDDATGRVIDTRSISGFQNGVYLVWNVTGGVTFRVTNTNPNAGSNAVVNGVFFGAAAASPLFSGAFAATDATTQGNWKPAYGGDGYDLAQDPSGGPSLPPYVSAVTVAGQYNFTWTGSTIDPRALQKSNSASDRVIGAWYSPTAFTIDVQMAPTVPHRIALYALDPDSAAGGRTERFDLVDDASGLTLDSRTISGFQNGVYLAWNVTGSVTVRVTNTNPNAGSNAVVNGLFFGAAAATPVSSASFASTDAATQGTWRLAYGGDGYDLAEDPSGGPSLPAYVSAVNIAGQSNFTWAASTADPRALQKPGSATGRFIAAWYSPTSFTIDVQMAPGSAHRVALYALDPDGAAGGRTQRFDLIDDATGLTLDTRSIANFQNGVYLVWNVTGSVTVRVTNTNPNAGSNAVVNGLFFGAAAPGATASFAGTDATTQGTWRSAYGGDGYDLARDPSGGPSLPAYVSAVNIAGQSNFTWAASTADPRALQKPGSATGRFIAAWYSPTSFTIDVQMAPGSAHRVALYALDPDGAAGGRTQRFDLIDDATGLTLDTRSIANFQNGVYLVWNVTGSVTVRVTNTNPNAGSNAVVNGLFFGAAVSAATASFAGTDATTQGSWKGVYGAGGYDLAQDPGGPSLPGYANSVAVAGQYNFTWAASTTDVRALQKPASATDRMTAAWYTPASFTIDLRLAAGPAHQVALYALDPDGSAGGRSQRFDLIDDATGATLDTRSIANFQGGVYLVWNVTGSVTVRVTNTNAAAGANAVVSGLFFGT